MTEYITVGYQVATYKGEVEVPRYDENEDTSVLFERAKNRLARECGGLPMGYQKFWIV